LLRQALATQRKALGDTHPVVATTLNSLSRVLARQSRYAEAASALRDALNIAGPAVGTDHQLFAIYSINLASAYIAQKQPALAEPLLREALAIRAHGPGIIPSRRRTFLEDDWSVDAIQRLLGKTSQ
jgi:tetratricopeptide (TPR) repeat protein